MKETSKFYMSKVVCEQQPAILLCGRTNQVVFLFIFRIMAVRIRNNNSKIKKCSVVLVCGENTIMFF